MATQPSVSGPVAPPQHGTRSQDPEASGAQRVAADEGAEGEEGAVAVGAGAAVPHHTDTGVVQREHSLPLRRGGYSEPRLAFGYVTGWTESHHCALLFALGWHNLEQSMCHKRGKRMASAFSRCIYRIRDVNFCLCLAEGVHSVLYFLIYFLYFIAESICCTAIRFSFFWFAWQSVLSWSAR